MTREPKDWQRATLTIDDPDDGGSDPGAWADALAFPSTLTALDLDGFTDPQDHDRNENP